MSESPHPAFHRLILRLDHAEPTPQMARAASAFAHLLGLHLHSIFVMDEAVLGMARLPFVRELRLPGHEWHPLDPDRLTAEFEQAALRAQRILADTARALGVKAAFEVVHGDPVSCLAGFCEAGNILAVMASTTARIGPSRAFVPPLESSILVLPARPAERHGPIAVVANDPDGRALSLAVRLAMAARTGLFLVAGTQAALLAAATHALALGMPKEATTSRVIPGMMEDSIARAVRQSGARLVVASRAAASGDEEAVASRMARATALPVLLT